MNSKRILSGLLAVACLSPLAVQAEVTWEAASWTFDTTNCESTIGPTGHCGSGDANFAAGRVYRGVGTGVDDVTVTGWANTISNNTQLELGQITHYSGGLGVRNADAPAPAGRGGDANEGSPPEHAIDNDERFDLVLFDFGDQLVRLNEVTLGWWQNDSDISVLAYTGTLDPTEASGDDYIGDRVAWWNSDTAKNEDLTSHGWQVIGNHDVDAPPAGEQAINQPPDQVASSFWIVSSYNPVFGSDCTPQNNYCQSDYKDYFKLLQLAGHVGTDNGVDPPAGVPVPEPATVLLMSLGLGFLRYRRLKA